MIKFQGKISQDCKKWFIKREFLCCLFIGLCTTLITGIGIVLFAVYWNLVALYFFIIPVLLTFMLCFQCISKYILKRLPLIITIEDGYIEGKNENEETWRNLDLLKTITDFGEWYVFNFHFPHKVRWFICQKNLIVDGTIEEFEELFEDKIVRKFK